MFINNSGPKYQEIAQGKKDSELVFDLITWNKIKASFDKK